MSPHRLLALCSSLLLVACGDKDGSGTTELSEDADGDLIAAEYDCDDGDPTVYPGAPELCNEVDDDCDGDIDEDPAEGPTWYLDADGDGAGSAVYAVLACSQPEGFVDNADDCNDGSVVSYPGADELCDELDNDCDDEIDESPVDATTWYVDEDGDGFGDPSVPIQACQAPDIYVTNGDDCDDSNAALNPDTVWYGDVDGDGYGGSTYTALGCEQPDAHVDNSEDCDDGDDEIHPGATEVCDGADNDCNGDADGADAEDATTFYEDLDLDGYGTEASTTMACEAPDGYAAELGDCDDTVDSTNPGAFEQCGDAIDNDCDDIVDTYCGLELSAADASWDGEADNDYAGYTVSASGDYDGDGVMDIAVGAYGSDATGTSTGRAYVALGPVSSGSSSSLADAALIVDGVVDSDYAGYAVGLGPDATGDSYGDALIGAWGADYDSYTGVGGAYLFAGPTSGSYSVDDADAILLGTASLDYLAQYEVHVGKDLNDDGQGDVIVGASGEDTPYSSGGLVAVFFGPVSGELFHTDADVRIEATGSAHYVGFSIDIADMNGDGVDDIAWGTSGDSAAYALYGPLSGTVDATDADVAIDGTTSSSFGSEVVLADLDGDGLSDLSVGAKYDNDGGTNAGAFFVFQGPDAGEWDEDSAVAKIIEVDASRYFGAQYLGTASGDVDGDGKEDLLLGSPSNATNGTAAGAGLLFRGPVSGSLTVEDADMGMYGEEVSDAVGYGVDLGDIDGDGLDDAVLGARGVEISTGRVYGVLGAGL